MISRLQVVIFGSAFFGVLILAVAGLWLAGCGSHNSVSSLPTARPSITTQPANQTVTVGQTATFSVTATGAAPISYQWQKNGSNISGATSASYTTPATTTADSGSTFEVVVSNSAGSATSSAILTVNAAATPPSITTQLANQTVTAGQTATFSVTATGTAPLSYQWQKNGSNISGATSASYTTPATTTADNGSTFEVVVSNSAGSATSSAILTVNAVGTPPSITTQLANQTVTAGQTATFSVTATGTAPLSYQWQKNGSNISGATSASYTTPATTTADNGSTFKVVVSNSVGNATSSATLTVNAAATPPSIATQPANQTVAVGQTATFSVTATGTAPLSYQWQKNGSNISGAASASYTTPATTTADNGSTFEVVVSNSVGNATSNTATLTVTATSSSVSVLTYHYDNARTGQNTNETVLTPSNVNSTTFGKLFSQSVDGEVYAQPLYVPNLTIGSAQHNVVFVATENDSVYAFDADGNAGSNANPLWKASLVDTAHGATSGETAVTIAALQAAIFDSGCQDLTPLIGTTSTPVIDPTTNTMYIEAKSELSGGSFVQRLHMLDITTGAEKSPGPAVLSAAVPGTAGGSTTVTFDPVRELNRPGLLLVNGTVYIGFGSHCDAAPYQGWLFAYNASTLAQTAVFLTSPNAGDAAIWMAGAGIAADSNANIFVATGNGTFNTTDFGNSILKLALTGSTLSLTDYFTPYNQATFDPPDLDLGSGGVLLLPDQPGTYPHELVEASKSGTIYVLNRDQLTTNNQHYCSGCSSDTEIIQELPSAFGGIWSMPAYWNGTVYFWGANDMLRAYGLSNGQLGGISSSSTLTVGFPGATPSISANGSTNGIAWAIDSSGYGSSPAVLHAYDATNLAAELYNSTQAAGSRDKAGNAVKFTVPVVVNGKVYIGTSTELDVYGILP